MQGGEKKALLSDESKLTRGTKHCPTLPRPQPHLPCTSEGMSERVTIILQHNGSRDITFTRRVTTAAAVAGPQHPTNDREPK